MAERNTPYLAASIDSSGADRLKEPQPTAYNSAFQRSPARKYPIIQHQVKSPVREGTDVTETVDSISSLTAQLAGRTPSLHTWNDSHQTPISQPVITSTMSLPEWSGSSADSTIPFLHRQSAKDPSLDTLDAQDSLPNVLDATQSSFDVSTRPFQEDRMNQEQMKLPFKCDTCSTRFGCGRILNFHRLKRRSRQGLTCGSCYQKFSRYYEFRVC